MSLEFDSLQKTLALHLSFQWRLEMEDRGHESKCKRREGLCKVIYGSWKFGRMLHGCCGIRIARLH